MPKALRRSNEAVSNLRPNSRARRQDSLSSACVGRRAISAYLPRYLTLAGSQKLSGWNCAITFTGAAGTRSEEFVVILPTTQLTQAVAAAENVRRGVAAREIMRRSTGARLGRVTVSIGVAKYREGESV